MEEATNKAFPRRLEEYGKFREFMDKAKDWQRRSLEFIAKY